jgi:uncharacterized protein (UPF0332 family)
LSNKLLKQDIQNIRWCLTLSKGIKLKEPDKSLSEIYLIKASNALRAFTQLNNNREWEISALYYSMYFALYSVLLRVGISSQNHSCTIATMNLFGKYFAKEDVELMYNSKETRKTAQYYQASDILESKFDMMKNHAKSFVMKCESILKRMTDVEILEIRHKIRNL